ncbi:MAG: CdaR family protein [Candidatus Limnocylindria bacterium]
MRVPQTIRPFPLRRRIDLRRAIVADLPLKAAAVLVAVLLWVAALEAAPREVVAAFPGRVPIEQPEVPSGYVLRGQLGDVAVRLRGPESALGRLAQQDLRATIDLTGVDAARPEPHEAKVLVASASARVTVVEVTPATIPVRLERVTTRTLAVQSRFANEPPAGFQAGQPTFSPPEVRVSGPESLVASVAAIFVTVRFGDAGVDLAQSLQAVAVDAAGVAVEGVRTDPAGVQVSVPVLPTATTRTVPVVLAVRGSVAAGYWITRAVADPAVVTVRGEQAALAPLDRVETVAVDVSGLTASRTVQVPVTLPAGVSLVRATDITATVTVAPLTGTRPFPLVAVAVNGLDANLVAELDRQTVEVVLAGNVPALAALAADAVSAAVDATGKGPGTYTVDVAVRAPAGTTVQGVQPARLTLTIRPRQ